MSLSSAILNPEADSRRGEVGGVELWQVMVTEVMPEPSTPNPYNANEERGGHCLRDHDRGFSVYPGQDSVFNGARVQCSMFGVKGAGCVG